jgi:hypothetical protein
MAGQEGAFGLKEHRLVEMVSFLGRFLPHLGKVENGSGGSPYGKKNAEFVSDSRMAHF